MKSTDFTPATKLTLLAILLKVDWNTWRGPCTITELESLAGLSRRAVQTAIKSLTDAGLVARSWASINDRRLPVIALNAHQIIGVQNLQGAKSAQCKSSTLGGANPAFQGANPAFHSAESAPLQYNNNNNTIIQPKEQTQALAYEAINETTLNSSLPKTQHKLTPAMINTIESHAKYSGHDERVKVAREHLNIKLLKGGYYEQI
jgi:DNA-binding transcriptional ArsR family regulator